MISLASMEASTVACSRASAWRHDPASVLACRVLGHAAASGASRHGAAKANDVRAAHVLRMAGHVNWSVLCRAQELKG